MNLTESIDTPAGNAPKNRSTSTDAPMLSGAGRTSTDRRSIDVAQLYRVRNGVRAVLALGVAASVAGNVLHAQPTIVGRAIASWSPLALLLTVELISRVPVYRLGLSIVRMLSTASIAGIAAWVSYGHMVSVALAHGELSTSAHLLPLSVDGLVVVASVSLVEIAARLHEIQEAQSVVDAVDTAPTVDTGMAALSAVTVPDAVEGSVPEPRPAPRTTAPRPVRSPKVSTATTVVRLRDKHPEWTLAQIADRAGVSVRTVRRHLTAVTDTATATDDTDTATAVEPSVTGPDTGPDDGDVVTDLAA